MNILTFYLFSHFVYFLRSQRSRKSRWCAATSNRRYGG